MPRFLNDEAYGTEGYDPIGYNQTRFGTVTARRLGTTGPEVQVTYDDRGLVSDWLPVGNKGTVGAQFFHCPRVNDQVKVSHGATGIEQGVVEAAVHSQSNPLYVPTSLDAVALRTDEGAYFEHDSPSGITTMTGIGEAHFSVGTFLIGVKGNFTITIGSTFKVSAQTINLNGVTIDSSGNVTIPGTLTVQGHTSLEGGALATPSCINSDGSGNGS